ncbi:MAG: hypothetical protein WCT04_05495 [Planctomycetota bacterium]
MIVAIVLANQPGPVSEKYFEATGDESVIERVTGTVLRGPFGGTLVAAHPTLAEDVQEALAGFAVQHVDVRSIPTTSSDSHAVLISALFAAEAFRTRWAKAMAAATGRFESAGGKNTGEAALDPKGEWSKLKKSSDVKIRGLARSFDRDGVLIIPADCASIQKEQLAQMVETFAREGQQPNAKPFVQAITSGERGWPVMLSLDGAREIAALPPSCDFSAWLLKNIEKVCDVKLN